MYLAFLLALALPGCVPTLESQDLSKVLRASTFDRGGEYLLGPGDLLSIRVYGDAGLSGDYALGANGTLEFPLVGSIDAQGLNSNQLARRLETALQPFLRQPRLSIGIAAARSFKVYLSGAVSNPGMQELRSKTSLLQGLILAGGLKRNASGKIYLIRQLGPTEVRRYRTSFSDLLRGQEAQDFVYLERGDIIYAD